MAKAYLPEAVKSLSPLESFVINSLNSEKRYSSSEIYRLVKKRKRVSRSSIPVILDRLYNKGLLMRETETARGGIRFIYTLQLNEERFERRVVENTVNALIKRFGEKAIAYFNESIAKKRK